MKKTLLLPLKKIFFTLFFGFYAVFSLAQKHDAVLSPKDSTGIVQPNLMLKFSLTTMLEPTPTMQIAVEHRLKHNISLQHELGYITSYPQLNVYNYWGLRWRTEMRQYFAPLQYNKSNTYIAYEIMGKYNQSHDNYWYCRDDCQYSQRFERVRGRLTGGLAVEYGIMRIFKDRFLLDIVGGVGVKTNTILHDDLPKELQTLKVDYANFGGTNLNSFWADISAPRIAVNLIFGIKVGYVLR
jgi:hypothetical protein